MNAIFESFQVNSISVSKNDYIECLYLFKSFKFSDRIRVKFLKSGTYFYQTKRSEL